MGKETAKKRWNQILKKEGKEKQRDLKTGRNMRKNIKRMGNNSEGSL